MPQLEAGRETLQRNLLQSVEKPFFHLAVFTKSWSDNLAKTTAAKPPPYFQRQINKQIA